MGVDRVGEDCPSRWLAGCSLLFDHRVCPASRDVTKLLLRSFQGDRSVLHLSHFLISPFIVTSSSFAALWLNWPLNLVRRTKFTDETYARGAHRSDVKPTCEEGSGQMTYPSA